MALKLSEGSNFTPAPAGLRDAVCQALIDLGMQPTNYGPKKQILCGFELMDALDDSGKPFVIYRKFTSTLNKQGNLKPFLEAWRGRQFTQEELKLFDMPVLLGKPLKLLIRHETNDSGKTYANIQAVVKPDKTQSSVCVNPLVLFDMDTPDEAAKAQLPEWIRKLIDAAIPPTAKVTAAASTATVDFDDDLTF